VPTLANSQNLWDCGGQNAFVDNYLTAQQSTIFANVAVLIYVFDITSTEWEADLKYFEEILTALREHSGDTGVWVLINKMDLADKEDPARKKYGESAKSAQRKGARTKGKGEAYAALRPVSGTRVCTR
jgi:Ras-related GTP-binding protein A/B